MTAQQALKLNGILTSAYKDYEKSLSAFAFFKLSNYETSKDLVQQTFMKTWLYLIKGGKIKKMKAFLYHALNNLIVDEYRRRKAISLDLLLEEGFEPSTGNAKTFMNTLDKPLTPMLIERLPNTYKSVIRMRYMQDLSIEEISRKTGKSRNAVSVQLHRGLEKLKQLHNSVSYI